MSATERRRALFYAEASAGFYDVSIERVVPQYTHLHDTTFQLLANHVRARTSDDAAEAWVLDIGSGTGAEALRVLNALPKAHVVAVDLCEPMHTILRGKAKQLGHLRRCKFVLGDIVAEECAPHRLRRFLPSQRRRDGYDAAVSAFTLHHLEHDEKLTAFQRVYEALRPGGIFLNADLFSFQSQQLSRQALAFDLSWIQEQLGASTDLPLRRRRQLIRQWHAHYRRYNRLEPIEDAVAEGSQGQAGMFVDAGFSHVAVPYRFWQTGILLAIK